MGAEAKAGTAERGHVWIGALVALLTVAIALPAQPGEAAKPRKPGGAKVKKKKAKKPSRPNIVVVMTDDQDQASAQFMPQLQALVAQRGVTFENSFASYSFCCPSRATYFTGQYAHNHGVLTNEPPAGGYDKLAPTIANTLPAWLNRSGYYTGLIGELLNNYHGTAVPPGWSEFYASYPSGAYGYSYNENGKVVHYGTTPADIDPATYQTDVQANKAVEFIRRRAPAKRPFYLNVATFAPHAESPPSCNCAANNPRAAPRDEGSFAGQPLPKPPSYNEADVSDKPALTSGMTPIPPFAENAITQGYRDRLESLQAVDDLVGRIVQALKEKRELRKTVIVFTSDNGFLHGEHRWRAGKVLPYEPSIKVPLIMRGPGVPKGKTREQLVANVDLAPTILDLAKAKPGRAEDGRSLIPLIKRRSLTWGRGILLEAYFNAFDEFGVGATRIVYDGVRTDRYMYARYETGEEELYDLRADPFELQSVHNDPAYAGVRDSLRGLTAGLKGCAGRNCRRRPGLRLRLRFRKGRGCVASGLSAKLAGPAADEVVSLRPRSGRTDAKPPFKFAAKGLSRRSKNKISATATMLDGREATVSAVAPRACGGGK